MWRGTAIFGNRTRLGRGKSGISIKSYEKFFVLACLIHRAAVSSKQEGTKAAAQALRDRSHFASRTHDRILNDIGRLINPIHKILADAVETGELNLQRLTGVGDHCFNPAELIAGGYSDLDKICRSDAEVFGNGPDRHHHFARIPHEAFDLVGQPL